MNAEAIPAELRERDQWLLWSHEQGKAPLNADGFNASWNDPSEWLAFDEALELVRSEDEFDGLGYVISEGDPYLGLDLDGCLREPFAEKPAGWLPGLDAFEGTYVEYSQSGTGIHVFTRGDDPPRWWSDSHFTDAGHEGVEAYAEKFFIVTGEPVETISGPTIEEVDVVPFLADAYETINGEAPSLPGAEDRPDRDVELGIYDVISSTECPEGENGPHPFHPSDSGTNFRVDPGGETFRCWRHKVTGNALHLLGIEQGVIDCGEWTPGGLESDVWADVFDAGREAGYDLPEPATAANGGTAALTGATEDLGGADRTTWDDVRAHFQDDARGSTTRGYGMAAEIIDDAYDIVRLRESDATYFYDETAGYWVRKGESYIGELLERHIPNHLNESRKRNIREKARDRNIISSEEFEPPEGKVNVKNGVLDLNTRELESHSPRYYFTAQLQVEWPEDDSPPTEAADLWRSALEDVTDDPSERKKLMEFVGYALEMWHHDREKNLFLVGPRLSGKSTIQEAIEALFGGEPTVTSLTPQQIADTQFDAAALREAALNTVNDINETKIENTGMLKRVFSGERIKMERKYQDAHFGRPRAKHLFTANWLPRLTGQDDAVYRRLLLIEFTKTIEDHEKDRGYKKRLRRHDVRQAILVSALDGRDRLYQQDGFSNDRTPTKTRRLWDSWRDSHKRFLYTQFDITGHPEDTVERESYWQACSEYAAANGYEAMSPRAITNSLQWVPDVYATGDSGTYGGLKWKDGEAVVESQIDDPRHEVKRHVEDRFEPDEEFTARQVAAELIDEDINATQVGHILTSMSNQGDLQRDGDTYWRL